MSNTSIVTGFAGVITGKDHIRTRAGSPDTQVFSLTPSVGPGSRLDMAVITPAGLTGRTKGIINEFGNVLRVPLQYSSIKAALTASVNGDVIVVSDGVYNEFDINFSGKAVAVISENGPRNCIINGPGYSTGFIAQNGEDYSSVIQGFTVKNFFYGILLVNSYPIVMDCIITGNTGGGVRAYTTSAFIAPSRFMNCILAYNSSADIGGAFYLNKQDTVLANCTVVYNSSSKATAPLGGGGIAGYVNTTLTLINSIVYHNTSPGSVADDQIILINGSAAVVGYSDIQVGGAAPPWPGNGNIKLEPQLDADFVPTAGSPCRDSGTLLTDYSSAYDIYGGRRLSGNSVDMGACEKDGDFEPAFIDAELILQYQNAGADPPDLEITAVEDARTLILPKLADVYSVNRSVPFPKNCGIHYRITSEPDTAFLRVGRDISEVLGGLLSPAVKSFKRRVFLQRDSVYRIKVQNLDISDTAVLSLILKLKSFKNNGDYVLP